MDGSKGTGIVVIGTTFVDIKGYPLGEYIPAGRNAGRVVEVHGGVSRNIAEDIANLGLHPTYVSTVDESGAGSAVVRRLEERGCGTAYIRTAADGLGTWLAVFDHTGDVVASISKRPDMSGIQRILDEEGDDIVSSADSIAVEVDIDEPILMRILELAEKHGRKVYSPVTNMTIAAERSALLNRIDCLVCNLQEAGILFGADYSKTGIQALIGILSEKIKECGIRSMVVTLGSAGAAFVASDGERGYCPTRPVDVVDTTGAGDAFFAGVAAGLTYGKTLEEACKIGTLLATSCISSDENVCRVFSHEESGL